MSKIIRSQFMVGEDNNYLLAGNICNAFALGEIGSTEDFFLVGAEPEKESNYPLLTGNILDSEGNPLFRLVRNILIVNPGNCSRIFGDSVGYEIHDCNDNLIFKVSTVFEKLPGLREESFITTIAANFYNKKGELVFHANSGEEDERIVSLTKSAFGFSGGFGLVQGMNEEEIEFTKIVLASRGAIHQPLRGRIENEEILLDGKALIDAQLKSCTVHLNTGEFVLIGKDNAFIDCKFVFDNAASNIHNLILALQEQENN